MQESHASHQASPQRARSSPSLSRSPSRFTDRYSTTSNTPPAAVAPRSNRNTSPLETLKQKLAPPPTPPRLPSPRLTSPRLPSSGRESDPSTPREQTGETVGKLWAENRKLKEQLEVSERKLEINALKQLLALPGGWWLVGLCGNWCGGWWLVGLCGNWCGG